MNNTEKLLISMTGPAQDVEDAMFDLFVYRAADTAFGDQLDALGNLVGQERGGLSDDDYRRFIRARVMANRSRGNIEDMIRVMNLVINDPAVTIELETQRGTIVVRLRGIITSSALAAIVLEFAKDSKSGGIRVVLESYVDVEAEMFTTARTAFLSGSVIIGATNLPVDPAYTSSAAVLEFPATGSLVLDEGTTQAETVTYSFRGFLGGVYTFTCSACTKTHAATTPMSLAGAGATGKGLGNSSDPGQPALTAYQNIGTTGGRMADARE